MRDQVRVLLFHRQQPPVNQVRVFIVRSGSLFRRHGAGELVPQFRYLERRQQLPRFDMVADIDIHLVHISRDFSVQFHFHVGTEFRGNRDFIIKIFTVHLGDRDRLGARGRRLEGGRFASLADEPPDRQGNNGQHRHRHYPPTQPSCHATLFL